MYDRSKEQELVDENQQCTTTTSSIGGGCHPTAGREVFQEYDSFFVPVDWLCTKYTIVLSKLFYNNTNAKACSFNKKNVLLCARSISGV